MTIKGKTWNESIVFNDPVSLKKVRRVTQYGQYNNTPTYHTKANFTADGDYTVFTTSRQGKSVLCKCHIETGDITALIEPVDGTGVRAEIQNIFGLDRGYVGNGKGVEIWTMVVAPKSRFVYYAVGTSIRSVHIDTLEEDILVEDVGFDNNFEGLTIDPDENYLVYGVVPAHPQFVNGEFVTKTRDECFNDNMTSKIMRVSVKGGEPEVLIQMSDYSTSHPQFCPTDSDLLLINREKGFTASTNNTNISRTWTYRISTKEYTEIVPKCGKLFQVHTTWTFDGKGIIYHGPLGEGAENGWFIGVIKPNGEVIREYLFEGAKYYGHVSADPIRNGIIVDGNLTDDLIIGIYYEEEIPRIEVIAKHETDWMGMTYQYPHPHPCVDPKGKYLTFNSVKRIWSGRNRSDIYIVEL